MFCPAGKDPSEYFCTSPNSNETFEYDGKQYYKAHLSPDDIFKIYAFPLASKVFPGVGVYYPVNTLYGVSYTDPFLLIELCRTHIDDKPSLTERATNYVPNTVKNGYRRIGDIYSRTLSSLGYTASPPKKTKKQIKREEQAVALDTIIQRLPDLVKECRFAGYEVNTWEDLTSRGVKRGDGVQQDMILLIFKQVSSDRNQLVLNSSRIEELGL